nr:sodium:proton antiporter [Variovorax dokdonensis]
MLLVILCAGLASQWLAAQIRLPAIVVLIAVGLLLGPVSGLVNLSIAPEEMSELIGLGVAIILFEGGMDLKLGEFKRVGRGVGRLTLLGPPLAWLFGSLAAHYVGGLSWPVAIVLGAILVVTGPTVILPLLRQAKLNKETAALLKWEGIVNDPIGVLLAVLAFQYFTIGGGIAVTLKGLGLAIFAALLFGGLGGWLIGWIYKRGGAPEHLKAPVLMVLVLAAYWASNQVQHEAGLLTVTLMGLVIGNMELVERESLQHFKENLTVVLLSVLFIVIPGQLRPEQLFLIDWRIVGFVVVTLLVVRPLSIGLATLGAPMRAEDKKLLAWIAPRGIVAVATAGIFGPALVEAGHPDAAKLLPATFLIVIVTVLAHGLSLGRIARKLGLASTSESGVLIVGASPWTCAFAQALHRLKVDVLMVDRDYERLKEARMLGIDVFYGEFLSEHAEDVMEIQHLSYLLCATDNDSYNALVCKGHSRRVGSHRTFQLAVHYLTQKASRRVPLQVRGYFAFHEEASFHMLDWRLQEGWTMQTSNLTYTWGWNEFSERMGELGKDWLLLGGIAPGGSFRIYSSEQPFKLDAGWTALYFAPERAARRAAEAAALAAAQAAEASPVEALTATPAK